MAKNYDAILLYSDDVWNNDREGDFAKSKITIKGKVTADECMTYYPCGLFYMKGETDDLGYECLNIVSDDKKYGFEVITITLFNADGRKIELEFPANSRKFPVLFGGQDGKALSFYIDGVETYRSSKKAKENAKKFIEERIEKLRNCDKPFKAESFDAEEMASEFSVERINPTPVTGKADMKAESFEAEENLAVADVEIHDGMNIPAGSGSIVGQAIPETDFTPFGASAESCACGANESCMCAEGWGKTCRKCTAPATVNLQDILMEYEVGSDPYEKMHLGDINEFFCKKHNDEMDDMWAESFEAEENLAVADVEIHDGMNIPAGSGAIVGQAIPETDFTPFGASAEESADPMPNEPDASAIIGQTSDGIPYTRFGYAAENLAVQDVEVWDGMVLPEGTGQIMGQMTPSTDFTPFGVSAESCVKCAETFAACGCEDKGAESYMEETFKPDGMGEVIGAITAETDYTPFGASAESMEVASAVMWEGKDDDNDGLIYGIEYMDGEEVSDVEWFKTSDERDAELKQYISDFGAEAFGGDLASLDDFNGVESVRVEAPLGHGVTENLGAEDINSYGGIVGVAAAFVTGMAYRHWANTKINGDDAPDSEAPSEESDDAPQA